MIQLLPRYIFNFFFFAILQVFILNKIEFSGYITPYLYIIFILTLPFETAGWFLLVIAAIMGLVIDMFSNTAGMHMSASLFMAFLRPYVLSGIAPRDGYEPGSIPHPSYYGFPWFFKYAAILTLCHHLFYFMVESFSFGNIFNILVQTILSSVFTLILMWVTLLFGHRNKRRI